MEPPGYVFMALHTVYEMACFLASLGGSCWLWRVDVLVYRSDKVQQFTFVVGVAVQKTTKFSQAQVGGTLRAQRSVRQWIHALRLSWCLWTCSHVPRDGGTSVPEVGVCRALWRLVVWRSVHSRCSEVGARGNLDASFVSALHPAVICSPSWRFRRRVSWASMTHSCLDSQVTCHQLVSETVVATQRCVATHVALLSTCSKQQQLLLQLQLQLQQLPQGGRLVQGSQNFEPPFFRGFWASGFHVSCKLSYKVEEWLKIGVKTTNFDLLLIKNALCCKIYQKKSAHFSISHTDDHDRHNMAAVAVRCSRKSAVLGSAG